ncbi:hypothetical protein LG943_02835 [Streptomonospora sp. S1-112]|uniref:Uncharacterized protein n=1 Tax=Streptomonospora mangrovi TaxID=2883123 RepID=A0A9X3NML0_9ACTN|nr:hypothetical protein [Streptomonospora mangrovi]MDA0563270.1 hypothetical protein [Streptomonospora mangrovi]
MDEGAGLAHILAGVPLYAPVDEPRRGRVSSTTLEPGGGRLLKAVVDFGSTPEGADLGPDLEIATRLWERAEPPAERDLRAFCAERDLMERRARDPLAAQSFTLGEDARWSEQTLAVEGRDHPCAVLTTDRSWVAAAVVEGGAMVRVFTPAPGPGPRALRRLTDPAELEPLRGRG